jgi:hypothetical protein
LGALHAPAVNRVWVSARRPPIGDNGICPGRALPF